MAEKICVFCNTVNDSEDFFCKNKECGKNLSLSVGDKTLDEVKDEARKQSILKKKEQYL